MQKNSRSSHRRSRAASSEIENDTSSPSYFQWREQTVRMPAVSPAAQSSHASPIVRMLRRIAGKT